jgi:hypothetical protein
MADPFDLDGRSSPEGAENASVAVTRENARRRHHAAVIVRPTAGTVADR